MLSVRYRLLLARYRYGTGRFLLVVIITGLSFRYRKLKRLLSYDYKAEGRREIEEFLQ